MTVESTIRLFSYGTLRSAEVQLATFGRLLDGTPDALPGFTISLVEITDPDVIATSGTNLHPVVVPTDDATAHVPGTVFSITEAELLAADTYEVADYHRIHVRLRSGIHAWVYVKATESSESLAASD